VEMGNCLKNTGLNKLLTDKTIFQSGR